MAALAMTLDAYLTLPRPARREMDAWVEDFTGEDITDLYVRAVELVGEGQVCLHRLDADDRDYMREHGEFRLFITEHSALVPPPHPEVFREVAA